MLWSSSTMQEEEILFWNPLTEKRKSIVGDKKEKKLNRMIRAIKRLHDTSIKFRFVRTVRAFNCWKYSVSNMSVVTIQKSDSDDGLKKKYLETFTENEKLREQIRLLTTNVASLTSSTATRLKERRLKSFKIVVQVILGLNLLRKKRYYFDVWNGASKFDAYKSAASQRTSELELGLQQVESDRGYVKHLEREVDRLQTKMAMTNLFFKWKSKTAVAQLAEERKSFQRQQRQALRELRLIREVVLESNKQEVTLLDNSVRCGDEVKYHLLCLKDQLASIQSAHSAHNKNTTKGVPC